MRPNPMTILIIEDDAEECNRFKKCEKERDDIKIVAITDSDVEGLKYVKTKKPEGIILDLELNNSKTGNGNSLGFMEDLKKLNLDYRPIVIVTTHVKAERTYEILHRSEVDLIMYKEQPSYSSNKVFNTVLRYRNIDVPQIQPLIKEENLEEKISKCINHELDLIGITKKLKGRKYIYDAILFLIQNENSNINVNRYLAKKYQKAETTITNGMRTAISSAWSKSSLDDLMEHYTIIVNYQTGEPTPMELIYYYVDKIKKQI